MLNRNLNLADLFAAKLLADNSHLNSLLGKRNQNFLLIRGRENNIRLLQISDARSDVLGSLKHTDLVFYIRSCPLLVGNRLVLHTS